MLYLRWIFDVSCDFDNKDLKYEVVRLVAYYPDMQHFMARFV